MYVNKKISNYLFTLRIGQIHLRFRHRRLRFSGLSSPCLQLAHWPQLIVLWHPTHWPQGIHCRHEEKVCLSNDIHGKCVFYDARQQLLSEYQRKMNWWTLSALVQQLKCCYSCTQRFTFLKRIIGCSFVFEATGSRNTHTQTQRGYERFPFHITFSFVSH